MTQETCWPLSINLPSAGPALTHTSAWAEPACHSSLEDQVIPWSPRSEVLRLRLSSLSILVSNCAQRFQVYRGKRPYSALNPQHSLHLHPVGYRGVAPLPSTNVSLQVQEVGHMFTCKIGQSYLGYQHPETSH